MNKELFSASLWGWWWWWMAVYGGKRILTFSDSLFQMGSIDFGSFFSYMCMSRSQPICSAFLLLLSPPISHPSTFLVQTPSSWAFFLPLLPCLTCVVCARDVGKRKENGDWNVQKCCRKKELFFLSFLFFLLTFPC